jgi:hypothetical protein
MYELNKISIYTTSPIASPLCPPAREEGGKKYKKTIKKQKKEKKKNFEQLACQFASNHHAVSTSSEGVSEREYFVISGVGRWIVDHTPTDVQDIPMWMVLDGTVPTLSMYAPA